MAILHSCCLWRSLRKGSYASAIYTLIYYLASAVIAATFLHEQRGFLAGEQQKPTGESFLEREAISSTTVIFNIILLICGVCGIITALLLVVGLRRDRREFLLPWILVMLTNMTAELAHFLYILFADSLHFDTFTATIFTIDFFLNCLNTYSLLCVISQYQELRAGRGTTGQASIFGAYRNVQYVPPVITTNVCQDVNNNNNNNNISNNIISHSNNLTKSKRAVKTSLLYPHNTTTNCTIIPEESQINASPEFSEVLSWQDQNGTSTNGEGGQTDKELTIL